MVKENMRFKASELCSRKLWQMVNTEDDDRATERELREAMAELASRRHYLAELQRMGKLEGKLTDA